MYLGLLGISSIPVILTPSTPTMSLHPCSPAPPPSGCPLPKSQGVYSDALHDLAVTHAARRDAACTSHTSPDLADLEDTLVRLTLDLIKFELEAGCTERAIARIQAIFEFHCFNPNIDAAARQLGAARSASLEAGIGSGSGRGWRVRKRGHYGAQLNQLALFWESGAPRVGEVGGEGWDAWFRHENRHLLAVPERAKLGRELERQVEERKEEEEAGGGWGGWQPLPQSAEEVAEEGQGREGEGEGEQGEKEGKGEQGKKEGKGRKGKREGEEVEGVEEDEAEQEEDQEEEEQEVEEEEEEEEVDEATLLERLGVKLERDLEDMQRKGLEPAVLDR